MVEIMNKRSAPPLTIVTGGAGFLGSHICDRLIAEGHEVLCLDNLLTGRIENIQHLWDHPRFVFVLHDVTNPIRPGRTAVAGGAETRRERALLAGEGWTTSFTSLLPPAPRPTCDTRFTP